MHPMFQLLFLALATSAASMTVSKAKVFKGIRAWLRGAWPWLGELVSCPYCTSHWVAVVMVAIWRPRPMDSGLMLLDLAASALAIVTLAAGFSGLIFHAFKDMPKES